MRYLVFLVLAGCSETMMLYPHGGGPPISGELDRVGQTMTVKLDGQELSGSYIRSNVSGSNQYKALLTSKGGRTLRCEFVNSVSEIGTGVCQTGEGKVFDLQLKP